MRKLQKLIKERERMLRESDKSLHSVYQIIFSDKTLPLLEHTDGYRVVRMSYADVEIRIKNVAYSLERRLESLKKGSFVGLRMENCPEWIVSFWALLMAGFQPFLINDKLPQPMIDEALRWVQAGYVLAKTKSAGPVETILYEALQDTAPENYQGSWADAIALSTTATTLAPKLCIYTGEQVAAQILNTPDILRQSRTIKQHWHGQLKQLAFLPFYHVFGLFAMYFWFTFYGRSFVFLKDYSGDTILRTCRKHEVTHIFAVPLLWHSIADEILAQARARGEEKKLQRALSVSTKLQNLSPAIGKAAARLLLGSVRRQIFGDSIRFMISGGSNLRRDALELLNGLGYSLHVGYGMSEIGISSVELRERAKDRNANSIGKPFGSVRYIIQGGTNSGELLVDGASVCAGFYAGGVYYARPDGPFATGDLVRRDEKGYYYFDGRKSDLVIGPSGENISPDSIEAQLKLPYRFCVLGLSEREQDVLCLVVQVPADLLQLQKMGLYESICTQNERLSPAERLQKIYFTENEIASPNAIKVSRALLRKRIAEGSVILRSFMQLQEQTQTKSDELDELSEAVREIFAQTLSIKADSIGPDAHFIFDLGGSSLQYFTLLSALNRRFGIKLESNAQYGYTVREFSAAVRGLLS